MGTLDGRVAIITGAGRGQGRAEAERFVAEGAGVVLTDVLDEEGATVAHTLGPAARFVHHDVASEASWASVVDTTLAAFGHLDALVNNAAIHWRRAIEDETVEAFNRMLQVNLVGTFLGIRAAIAPMRASGGGAIVNVSSLAGLQGLAWHGAYGSSKWAVRGLTKTAAIELGPDHIRVNSVHPGPIETAMLPADTRGLGDARFQHLPLARSGQPSEVADLVTFLVSDASAYVTGSEFTIDGGSAAGPPAAPRPDRGAMNGQVAPELPATSWAVLGLLSFDRELSGYELKKWADTSLRFFYWSPASSQIYSELRRLERLGFVTSRIAAQDDLRNKRLYRITPTGTAAIREWVEHSPVEPPVLKHGVALRAWLGHLATPEHLRSVVEQHRDFAAEMASAAARAASYAHEVPAWAYPELIGRWSQRYYDAERDLAERLLEDLDELTARNATGRRSRTPAARSPRARS